MLGLNAGVGVVVLAHGAMAWEYSSAARHVFACFSQGPYPTCRSSTISNAEGVEA